MTDTAPDTGTPDAPSSEPAPEATPDLNAEVEKWKNLARKHEDRAKANASAAKELEELKASQMSDVEKAVAEAKAAGAAEARQAFTARLVEAEIKAAAAGRLAPEQLDALIPTLNLSAFAGEDGEIDTDKVEALVASIAPAVKTDEPPGAFTAGIDIGQGARGVPALNGDPLLSDLKSKLGI